MLPKKSEELEVMQKQVKDLINQSYKTVEEFCWEKNLSKATLSNFLNGKKDFQISTLARIAKAFKKKLVVRLEWETKDVPFTFYLL